MKFFMLFAVLLLSPLAHAATCQRCSNIQKLEQEYSALKLDVLDDMDRGYEKMDLVLKAIELFENDKKKSTEELKALVGLTAAALPFDPEKSLSHRLAVSLRGQETLNKHLRINAKTIKSDCHRQLFEKQIEAFECSENLRGGIAVDAAGKSQSCGDAFDFKTCLSQKQ